MRIDTTAIEGYAEMSADEKVAALEAFEYEDQAGEVEKLRGLVSRANSQAAASKKQAKTDADALAELRAEMDALKRDKTVSQYTAKFIAQGYTADLAASTAEALADGQMDKVFENQQTFLTGFQQTAAANAIKATPRPGNQQAGSTGTDYNKLIADAQSNGDYATAGYYMRLAQTEGANT